MIIHMDRKYIINNIICKPPIFASRARAYVRTRAREIFHFDILTNKITTKICVKTAKPIFPIPLFIFTLLCVYTPTFPPS